MRSVAKIAVCLTWTLAGLGSAAHAQLATDPKQAAFGDTTDVWVRRAKLDVGLSQSYYTTNWAGDEVGTVAWLAGVDALLGKQLHPKFKWENTLVLGFGQTHQQNDAREWDHPTKSTDKIDFDSFGRFTLGRYVDPYIALTFDSQFYESRPGYGTRYVNPFQIGEMIGIARPFYDTKNRSLIARVGFGLRQRMQRFYGEDPSVRKEWTNDGGFELRIVGRFIDVGERTEFKTDLYVFQAVFFSEADLDQANRWKQTDVRWQNTFSHKLYKAITLNLYVDYVYDAQVRRAGQLKQTMGLGLSHTF